MNYIIKCFIILLWIVLGIIGAGFLNANSKDRHWLTKASCDDIAHSDQSFFIIYGLITGPIGLITSMAFTGFGYKGWSLDRHKCEGY